MKYTRGGRKKVGRPPRTDSPVRIQILLPDKLRRWLRVQAALEMRDQGDVVTEALEVYRRSAKRRRRP